MEAPDWFVEAVATPANDCFLDTADCRLHYRRYAAIPGRPLLAFVHGHGAHCRWWDFIAPAFTQDYNVISIDLAGAGDSGHRDTYSAMSFSQDLIDICRAESEHPAWIVGHSFGGSMTRIAGYRFGNELAGIVLADSVISDHKATRPTLPASSGRVRYYGTLEQGKRRFRLRPPQPCENGYIIDYIAGHSLRETPAGFCFKLDQDVFAKMVEPEGVELPDGVTTLQEMACPAALIYGEQSRFYPPASLEIAARALPPDRIVGIPDAYHHLFLDQPLDFIERLTALLRQFTN